MPTDVDRELSRIGGTLDRVRARTDLAVSGRNRQHRETEVVRRIGRIAAADGLILAGAIVFGLAVAPLGMMGAMLVAMMLVAATLLFAVMPTSAPVNVEKLAEIPLKALPRSTERWLETQRPALPSPVRGLVDSIGVKLETLKTKLLGGSQAGVAVLLSAEQGSDNGAHAAIQDFLGALGPVENLADRMTGVR